MKHTAKSAVDVYPVGVLHGARIVARMWRSGRRLEALRRLRYNIRALLDQVAHGEWRALKNSFSGYLAEPRDWPDALTRCGSGWTKARALRSLHRHAERVGVTL